MSEKETLGGVKFWAPYTADFESADYSLTLLKSPELENTESVARNQSLVRTRAGNTLVYDRGNDFNTKMRLEFRDVPDDQRSALVVFLNAIQWATTKVMYRDVYGDDRVVRIVADDGITYTDLGTNLKKGRSFLRWNFNLELLNLTDNPGELETVDPVPSSSLYLHITDYDEPHNPELCVIINDADGAVVIDSFNTLEWRSHIFTVVAKKGTASAVFAISVIADRADATTDATATQLTIDALIEQGTVASIITFTAVLSGTGINQIVQLKADVSNDGWYVCVRRLKMGAQAGMYL